MNCPVTTTKMTPEDAAKCVKRMYRDADGIEVKKPVIPGVRRRNGMAKSGQMW